MRQGTIEFRINLNGICITAYSEEQLFDKVLELTRDDFLAMEISSWAELAPIGDVYFEGSMNVEVVEATDYDWMYLVG